MLWTLIWKVDCYWKWKREREVENNKRALREDFTCVSTFFSPFFDSRPNRAQNLIQFIHIFITKLESVSLAIHSMWEVRMNVKLISWHELKSSEGFSKVVIPFRIASTISLTLSRLTPNPSHRAPSVCMIMRPKENEKRTFGSIPNRISSSVSGMNFSGNQLEEGKKTSFDLCQPLFQLSIHVRHTSRTNFWGSLTQNGARH